jgi:hypothetical protein
MRRLIFAFALSAVLAAPAASTSAQRFAQPVPPPPLTEDCPARSHPTATAGIRVGATCASELTSQTRPWMRRGTGEHGEIWLFDARQDDCVDVRMRSTAFDPYLEVGTSGPGFPVIARDDDSGGGLNARVQVRLARAGTYYIFATAVPGTSPQMGRYTVSIDRVPC